MATTKARPGKKKQNNPTMKCAGECKKEKSITNFYKTRSALHPDGYLNICKLCISRMMDENDVTTVFPILQQMDLPFISKYCDTVSANKGSSFGNYLRIANSGMNEFKDAGWKDSVFDMEHSGITTEEIIRYTNTVTVNDEMIQFFGSGFSDDEYIAMHKKYNFLKNNYPEKTNMHIEALATYVRYKVKEEFAVAKGSVTEAEKWGKLASSAATSAKINPSQLTAADLSDGLSTFGQLTRAVEQAVDVIDILPRFKQMPHDTVDFTILCYVNYIRNLQGLPLCDYEEIYKFYDERKKEYAPHLDFLEEDNTENNRKSVRLFMDTDAEEKERKEMEEGDEE